MELKTFKEFALDDINEMKFTKRTDYNIIGREYSKAIEWLYDARKLSSMCVFDVDGTKYYSILVMRDHYLEPHFGVFMKGKFIKLVTALKTNDQEKLNELLKDKEFIQKDGFTDSDSNFVKILSYVFSFMTDYLNKKEIGFIKIMGNPRKFKIYKKLTEQNLETLPYTIIDEIDDKYINKDGEILNAKALILKYNFA
jgi:hypothetical protein